MAGCSRACTFLFLAMSTPWRGDSLYGCAQCGTQIMDGQASCQLGVWHIPQIVHEGDGNGSGSGDARMKETVIAGTSFCPPGKTGAIVGDRYTARSGRSECPRLRRIGWCICVLLCKVHSSGSLVWTLSHVFVRSDTRMQPDPPIILRMVDVVVRGVSTPFWTCTLAHATKRTPVSTAKLGLWFSVLCASRPKSDAQMRRG
jgi:hypothetical protein